MLTGNLIVLEGGAIAPLLSIF